MSRPILSTSTINGVTITYLIGRVQTDPSDAGIVLTIYPDKIITDSAGGVLTSGFDTPFTVSLTEQQAAGIVSLIQTAWNALP